MRYRRRSRPNYTARIAGLVVFLILAAIGGTVNGCAPVQPTSFVSTYP